MSENNIRSVPIKDTLVLAGVSGMIGTLLMYLVGVPLYLFKFSRTIYLLYSVEFFIKPELSRTTAGFISGALVGLVVGAGLAMGFLLLLHYFGTDWFYTKALIYGSLSWFFWVGLTRAVTKVTPYLYESIWSNIFLLLESWIYALATAYVMKKLGHIETRTDRGFWDD